MSRRAAATHGAAVAMELSADCGPMNAQLSGIGADRVPRIF
jgi:hypothetical protein